jgi:hypothetical protein
MVRLSGLTSSVGYSTGRNQVSGSVSCANHARAQAQDGLRSASEQASGCSGGILGGIVFWTSFNRRARSGQPWPSRPPGAVSCPVILERLRGRRASAVIEAISLRASASSGCGVGAELADKPFHQALAGLPGGRLPPISGRSSPVPARRVEPEDLTAITFALLPRTGWRATGLVVSRVARGGDPQPGVPAR